MSKVNRRSFLSPGSAASDSERCDGWSATSRRLRVQTCDEAGMLG
jgi:hypothetical protein